MESRPIEALDLCGGDPALDFVNTLGGVREGPWDDEWLRDYRDIAAWSRHAGLVADPTAARLLERAAADPAQAAHTYAEALALRETMYRIFGAEAYHAVGSSQDLAALAAGYRDALAHARLVPAQQRMTWVWEEEDVRLPLWLLADAAVDLLRSARLGRLSQCGRCRWLFLDASKNRSRRWCSMAHCGIDAKVRRARARRHVQTDRHG
jgi:predicted RNA-binding Zn ribbon-like protein